MAAKGLEKYPDHAVSVPSTIYETYDGDNGRDFKADPLKPNERVASHKKQFPGKVAFPEPGTAIETLEVVNGTGKPHIIAPFQFVVTDVNGYPYAKDIKDLKKRFEPEKGNKESKTMFDTVGELLKKRESVKAQGLSEKAETKVLEQVWKEALPVLRKLAK